MSPTMDSVRVRVHITDGQRSALIAVLERSPSEAVRVSDFTVTFDMDDPRAWLEARMAEWPLGVFPRASLHGVLRKLRSAVQGQVEPDLPLGQERPDLRPAVLRLAAALIRSGEELRAGNAVLAAVVQAVPAGEARDGLPMLAIRAVAERLSLTPVESPLTAFTWWDQDAGRADVIEALEATAAALDGEEAES
ncbi:hypothetical protein [Nonomuraea angiospora]|uniref:hypothetical protein n=1 Tax=Nonomuraea angiospora TaxID=46172 RepID=UPI0029A64487|nr:hypothetical protein [Nonomuraea angiospora]MDX3101779.1 hypothetical protein [Nonomuraea angiospora]